MAAAHSSFQWFPAIASFLVPGLGQLIQGRPVWAAVWFFTAVLVWAVTLFLPFLALVVHGAAAAEAGLRKQQPRP